MDPWSKGDYSRLIREASMVVEKLPVVVLPSGRVPGRVLLMLPILEALRRRNRGEITKKGSVLQGFGMRGIYMRRGATRGGAGAPGAPLARPGVGSPPSLLLDPANGEEMLMEIQQHNGMVVEAAGFLQGFAKRY